MEDYAEAKGSGYTKTTSYPRNLHIRIKVSTIYITVRKRNSFAQFDCTSRNCTYIYQDTCYSLSFSTRTKNRNKIKKKNIAFSNLAYYHSFVLSLQQWTIPIVPHAITPPPPPLLHLIHLHQIKKTTHVHQPHARN